MALPHQFQRQLTDADRVAFAHQVVAWKQKGLTNREMAERSGLNVKAFESRMQKDWFKALASQARGEKTPVPLDAAPEVQVGEARKRMTRLMSEKGVEFLETCLSKDGKTGQFVSRADARYAVDRLLPATGLNEAEDGRRRLGDIKLGVIMAQMAAIRGSDARHHAPIQVAPAQLASPARSAELDDIDEGGGDAIIDEEPEVIQIPEP